MNSIGQNFDDFLKEQGIYDEVNKMILEKLAECSPKKNIYTLDVDMSGFKFDRDEANDYE